MAEITAAIVKELREKTGYTCGDLFMHELLLDSVETERTSPALCKYNGVSITYRGRKIV